jgi:transcription factor IIIB subunit 2
MFRAKPAAPAAPKAIKKACCADPDPMDQDGQTVCSNCATIIASSTYSTELTFGENAAGGATIVGGFIGENQRHASTMGGAVRGIGGGGGVEGREKTVTNGTEAIVAIVGALNLPAKIVTAATGLYKLGLGHNFVQGRRIKHVAAVAIYLAARKQAENTILLIDLSEYCRTNVWELGRMYKEFCRVLMDDDPVNLQDRRAVLEIEPLMLKFCRKLEFGGEDLHRVASDACKVLRSMDRDWMKEGRNPAGLCGACILMAARMNNFRRTVREVVYVVKVADTTIHQRLYEYKQTESSKLTVGDFRKFGDRMPAKDQPPAVWRPIEKEKKRQDRERKRKAPTDGEDDNVSPASSPDDSVDAERSPQAESSNTKKSKTRANKKQKITKNKAKTANSNNDSSVPDSNTSEDSEDATSEKRDPIDPKDLEIEKQLEEEIHQALAKSHATFQDFLKDENHPILIQARERAEEIKMQQMPDNGIEDNVEDLFEDDDDVATCILNEEESLYKERVWLSLNEDWLRKQQAKILAKALEEAEGKPKKPKQRRQRHQMGNGEVLGDQPAASPEEAMRKMALKRGGKAFSNLIDYDAIKQFRSGREGTPATRTPTPEGSTAAGASQSTQPTQQWTQSTQQSTQPTQLSDWGTPTPARAQAKGAENADADAEEEDYDEQEQDQYPIDDEYLENEHEYDDDDEGFGDDNEDDGFPFRV